VIEGVVLHEQGNASLDSLDAHALSDDELEAAIVGLHRSNQSSAAHEARMIALFDSRRAYRSDGSRSAAARLARKTGGSRKELGSAVSLGRRLRLMPLVDAALATGEITVEHARILGKLAASDRRKVAESFVECEAGLVGFAKDLEFGDFARAVRYWEQRVDADGAEETAGEQHARRHLHVSQTFDGVFALDGILDPVGGTVFTTALRRIENELFEADWADAKAVHGDDTRPEHLQRTPAQRRADALVIMAERAMAMPPGSRLPAPLITVHVGYETFAGPLCELSSGTVITPGQVIPLLDRAYIERAVFEGPNRIIELGERTRFFRGGLRRCVEIIHRRCVHPGCDVSAEECDIDHEIEFNDGGLTTQENGKPRCKPDHRHKSRTGNKSRKQRPPPDN
jgi:hypothetical protein